MALETKAVDHKQDSVNYPSLTLLCGYLSGKILNIKEDWALKWCEVYRVLM